MQLHKQYNNGGQARGRGERIKKSQSYRAGSAFRSHHHALHLADKVSEPKEVKWHIQVYRVCECWSLNQEPGS